MGVARADVTFQCQKHAGFDASDEGIATAQRNATRAGVKIKALRETEAAFDYGVGQWDLIVFTYEPFPITSDAYVERLGTALKPGGIRKL